MVSLFFYNIFLRLYLAGVFVASFFNKKAELWLDGRKSVCDRIRQELSGSGSRPFWFHCASLGEFEQARPLIERIKHDQPERRVVVTFFSPSGYEIRKDYHLADGVYYLPMDSGRNARRFLDLVNPEAAFIVKYEFWYHYLKNLHERKIPAYLVAGVFRPDQAFFKWYGGLFRKMLSFFTTLFVQDKRSFDLLKENGFVHAVLSGDTRFDRVSKNCSEAKPIPLVEAFTDGRPLLVGGSTWKPEEEILAGFLKKHPEKVKLVIAPHDISEGHVSEIERLFEQMNPLRFSEADSENIKTAGVLIIDNIGMLSSLYRHGDFAFIGGAFGKGLHNILEAATFGLPVFFGPRTEKFFEAGELVERGGAFQVHGMDDFEAGLLELLSNPSKTEASRTACKQYVSENLGATRKILEKVMV